MLLFAQEGVSSWLTIVNRMNPWSIAALAVICMTAAEIVRRVLRHRERIAMIQAGMNPNERSTAADD